VNKRGYDDWGGAL